ncbi:MAG: hypothetical protein NVS9B13_10290 [Candidatus Acidiferrum sp.]
MDDSGIWRIGDGAGENLRRAAEGVSHANHGNFNGFESPIVIKIEARELLDAQFIIDFHRRMNFLAAGAVGFEADARFQKFDARGHLGWS